MGAPAVLAAAGPMQPREVSMVPEHVLRAMLDAGATAEMIVRVVLDDNALCLAQQSTRREANRIRVKNQRSRARTNGHIAAHSSTPKSLYVEDSLTSTPQSKKESKKNTHIRTPIPTDFWPNETGLACARKRGWDDGYIRSEVERFKDHAMAKGRMQVDWHAAWRMWVNSPFQQKEAANGPKGRMETDPRSDNPCKPGTVAWWTRERLAGRA